MTNLQAIGGSFRDPAARVYTYESRLLRGLDTATLANFENLTKTRFFRAAVNKSRLVRSQLLDDADLAAVSIMKEGWAGVIEHERLPLLSYPYEWTFSMLKDAAILHLDLLENALGEGWIIKDSSPYNIQFVGSSPEFIDIPSFTPRLTGDYWRGYRQFCMCFLYPLMLTAYRHIPFHGLLRSSLDGIEPMEAARILTGFDRFRKGVLSHVHFPAMLERRYAMQQESDSKPAQSKTRPQSDTMLIALVQSMKRIVRALPDISSSSTWSDYITTHSYDLPSLEEKKVFVAEAASQDCHGIVWDLGSNTGTFSELLSQYAEHVVSLDSDHECVERLYLRLRNTDNKKILPLYMNLANPSPNQGWASAERLSFDSRNKPDLILSLALIHHICLSDNIPISYFLDWLAGTSAKLIIEFVDRNDVMVKEMLSRKLETYEDYNIQNFEKELEQRYEVIRSMPLKDGERKIYFCVPRQT